MDELKNFYSNPESRRVRRLRGPRTCGIYLNGEEATSSSQRKEEHSSTKFLSGKNYVENVIEREEAAAIVNYSTQKALQAYDAQSSCLDSMETLSHLGSLSTITGSKLDLQPPTQALSVYDTYPFSTREQLDTLPIYEFKAEILKVLNSNQVLVIEGPTGCGKTTQVPQWILDEHYQSRKHCKIVVTQPRRIAAMSIAKRVAHERGWDVGGVVGYQVGLDNRTSKDTLLSYVTTGVLLQKLVLNKNLNEYTHIILDEVHERGQEMDFLLLVVKKLLYSAITNTKIILMSATFDTVKFTHYFKQITASGLHNSVCVQVIGTKKQHNVKTFYMDSLSKFGALHENAIPKNNEPHITTDMYKLVVRLIHIFERLDKEEAQFMDDGDCIPSVLIFLPGINEIEEMYGYLEDPKLRQQVCTEEKIKPEYDLWVLPLHSTITADEQVRVFKAAPSRQRKVILSTNIAESSITVPDIKYVIDFCLMKTLVVDPHTNFTSLELGWAAHTNCIQRGGRAGRVREGRVYRLVREDFYKSLADDCPPELVRAPLERLVLLAKTLDMGSPTEILALALDPPDLSNIHRTSLVLKEMGAMLTTLGGKLAFTDGDLTYLGRVMSSLPMDVRVSKMIFLGYIFGVMDDCIIIAAAMTVRNPFSNPFRERLNAYNSRLAWADGSCSDLLALHSVYTVWSYLKRTQHFRNAQQNEAQWARRFYVQLRALREIEDMVRELKQRLSREHIVPVNNGHSPWTSSEKSLALKLVIAGAFYPHYFVQVATDESREREAVRQVGGLDPRHTVFLQDFPPDQPGPLYARNVAAILHKLTGYTPTVTFDNNCRKVYLTFDDINKLNKEKKSSTGLPDIPGKVTLPVYKAVKIRQLKLDINLALLPPDEAKKLVTALEGMKKQVNKGVLVPRLPDIDDTTIPLTISQVPESALVCYSCWMRIYRELQRQGIIDTPSENLISCVWCSRSLANTHRHSLPEGTEYNYIAAQIHPRVIPLGGRVCRACWIAVRQNIQRQPNIDPPSEIPQLHRGCICVWCQTSLFRRRCHRLLHGPERSEVADRIYPRQYVNAGQFWCRYDDKCTAEDLHRIQRDLNRGQSLLVVTGDLQPGDLVAAPYIDPAAPRQDSNTKTDFYRARVHTVHNNMVTVFYIDYGSYGYLNSNSVFELPREGSCRIIPPLSMECVLCGLGPSVLLEKRHNWTAEANRTFCQLTANKPLLAQVYSVVRGIVSVELFAGDMSINKELIRLGLAQPAEESYESKRNHDIRTTATELNMAQKNAYNKQQLELAFHELRVMEGPSPRDCTTTTQLKGPFSPLESSVRTLMFASLNKNVNIEWNSVNSVLLDTDPQEMYERLLIAGMVGTNEMNSNLTLRHTTLMPNIPGLPAIVALLFCPRAEFRCDARRVRYVSALCGLGPQKDGVPLFPEHDILVDIDVALDDDDLSYINHVRHLMDTMIKPATLVTSGREVTGNPHHPDSINTQVPVIIRENIIKLLDRRRIRQETYAVPRAWEWNSCTAEIRRIEDDTLAAHTQIYPLHHVLMLDQPTHDEQLQLLEDTRKMEEAVTGSTISSNREVVCVLCGTEYLTVQSMRIHLHSRAHLDRLNNLCQLLGVPN